MSLKDIFEKEEEVDEILGDLAGSMEDVSARELDDDRKEFSDDLEASMPSAQRPPTLLVKCTVADLPIVWKSAS